MRTILLFVCCCVFGAFGQQGMPQPGIQFQPGVPGTQTGFQGPGFSTSGSQSFQPQPGIIQTPGQPGIATGGFGPPFVGPFPGRPTFGPGPGSVFGPMGPLRPLSPPLSPMAMMMASLAQNPNNYRYATCNFNDTWSQVRGRMDLRQFLIGEGRQQVQIRIQISGLPQSVMEVDRGIHIHEFGDIGDGCARVGPHFNPNQTPHGSQRNFAFLRHVGDLGNIRQSTAGLVSTQFVDQVISLEGSNNVVGRAFVIKLEQDDLGLGGSRESRVNGNTHNPLACCTIGRTTARNWYNPMSAASLQNMAVTGIMPYNTIDPFNTNTFLNTGLNTGGIPNTGPNTGFPPGFQNPGGFPVAGVNTGFPSSGMNTGFPQTGSSQTGFGGPGGMPSPGFGPQTGFGATGLTQQNFGIGGLTQGGTNTQTNQGLTQGGLTQGGLTQGGLTQSGFTQTGLTQAGFSGTGTNSNQQTFGAGTFMPGAAPGQTFNFANQGKKK
ncbi:uncharacterized PPE family protein PPE62-like [Mercenaria mercenaria]|uniref:uncharacterized PPE family protein PPE62-like n=1 Tax=Mercenaria mercenaria TaxID=6596 RepID=UPI00234E6BCB|nr:uncharacterized PPE family protein PPE62-like [Mercenaria mercenaria]